jgi:lysozyme family protein
MQYSDFIKKLQSAMNAQGENLAVDGVPGPKTQAALLHFDASVSVTKIIDQPAPPQIGEFAHLKWFEDRMGWTEHNAQQSAELSKGWVLTKYCKAFKTVKGREYAWCGMSAATAFKAAGLKYPVQCETAAQWIGAGIAYDWKRVGIKKGSIVVLGTHHVTLAHEDAAPGAKTVACIGGNQSDEINVTDYATAEVSYVGTPISIGISLPVEPPKPGGVITTGQDPDEGTAPWYRRMWAACEIDAGKEAYVKSCMATIEKGMGHYLKVASLLKAKDPQNFAYLLGVVHFKEASCDFRGVLHNGEKIVGTGKKTSIVPKGRGPFATWEDAAVDAIGIESSRWKVLLAGGDSIGDILYALERYNGTGYITGAGKAENSPYLWACSNINDDKGKYVSDGKFDANAGTNSTVGAAVLLKEFAKAGKFQVS